MIDRNDIFEILVEALYLIRSKSRFNSNLNLKATDLNNKKVSIDSSKAYGYSILGAIERSSIDSNCIPYILYVISELEKDCNTNIVEFSKSASYDDVVALFNKTIKRFSIKRRSNK